MTNLLKQFIVSQFPKMKPTSTTAKEAGTSVTTVLRLFDHVSYPRPHLSETLSIDEFKGNANREKFQCMLVDPKSKTALDILKSRKTAREKSLAENLLYAISPNT